MQLKDLINETGRDPANFAFKEIIDTARLQKMMEKFYKATRIPVGILDTEGEILVATGWQEICTQFHRKNPITQKRCQESDNFFHDNMPDAKFVQYKCQNGLWDIGIPILVQGTHMASLFVGQFFYEDEKPDIEFFRNQALEVGFDVEAYLDALKNIRTFSREEINDIMSYYADFASFIAELAYSNLQLKQQVNKLEGLLPICSHCKKIRDDQGYWKQIELYISQHSEVRFSHGLCESCYEELYANSDYHMEPSRKRAG